MNDLVVVERPAQWDVANATDVAKAAASIVLTNPGLSDIVSAVETSPARLSAHAHLHAEQNHQDHRNRLSIWLATLTRRHLQPPSSHLGKRPHQL
jgi:hypothetical protein